MIANRKFERAARSRRVFAFWAAVGLHLALLAAVLYRAELAEYLPDFIENFVAGGTSNPPPVVP